VGSVSKIALRATMKAVLVVLSILALFSVLTAFSPAFVLAQEAMKSIA
jgi:hypothetical protein